jgi:hypothetical protein
MGRSLPAFALLILGLMQSPAYAADSVCAQVKIEIKQELTLERQAFDAEMKINNALENASLTDVSVVVKVTDELGVPVLISSDPNNTSAKFFVRISNKQNISDVDGTGAVAPSSTAIIDWLLIPAPGSAGASPLGKKFLVGATLQYKFGGELHTLDVSPDVITVKPLPQLTLDYFLTQEVIADNPFTAAIEPAEPFTLGVRVKNTGAAAAKNLKIDSAQPKIIENKQGLLINFKLDGSYVNDAPVLNTLLINFGDIQPGTSKMGRWLMETTLAGKFTEFTASFSHSDELGGALTSILQATNAHLLIRDVRVDLPGRDYVRDFLAKDGDVIRVYESDGADTVVQDLSAQGVLTSTTGSSGNAAYRLVVPPTQGFIFVKLPDPFGGQKALGQIARSDAKVMLPENVWLSKSMNAQTNQWDYWINFFDANTPGVYTAEFNAPPAAAQAPVIQFIPDQVVKEGSRVSFLVESSSPDGKAVTLSAAPLPTAATFAAQAPQGGTATSLFDWTPAKGQAGSYLIVYTASDGTQTATRSAVIKVETNDPPPGPGTPTIDSPLSGAQVPGTKPALIVQTSTNEQDPTAKVQFEIYKDEAMTQLVESGLIDKGTTTGTAGTTSFTPAVDLNDNTHYWWRARAYDGTQIYSLWVSGRFFVNLFNDPPDTFNLTSPTPSLEVASLQPALAWTNSADKDGDAITYSVYVYRDAALTDLADSATGVAPGEGGATSWTVSQPLTNHVTYYWRAVAKDANGAETPTAARPFVVNIGNTAPSAPAISNPAVGGQTAAPTTALTIQNSVDAESDLITYVFELDTVNTFDSGSKRNSGQVIQSAGQVTSWTVDSLVENKRYWWRVKAQDGRAESDWVVGDFLMNAVNDPPPTPTVKNPGDGAWTATQQPSLEANPVLDPEGEAVRYQFEVYRDAGLTLKAADGTSDTHAWIVPALLADKTTHWWRVRAMDVHGAASVAWSPATILYVSTAPYQDPTIQVTAPATPIVPTVNGVQKTATIRWEGTDPNIEPTIALYYTTSTTGFNGMPIVDGLKQTAGTQSGSYVWDVSGLAQGAYYVYGMIYDAKGVGRAYAPGAVVIPNSNQTGAIVVTAGSHLKTSEDGRNATFKVRLGSAPIADVVVPLSSTKPREGAVEPASLVFTAQNWNVNQTVTVTGTNDCAPEGTSQYQVLVGKALSLDPDYIGLSGTSVEIDNRHDRDRRGTTNNRNLHICNYTVVGERKIDRRTWEYTLKAELTNSGGNVSGVTATLNKLPGGIEIVNRVLSFGAVAASETVKSTDTVVLRSRFAIPNVLFQLGIGFHWEVVAR